MPASTLDKLLLLLLLLLLGHQSGLPNDWMTSLPIKPGSLLGTAAASENRTTQDVAICELWHRCCGVCLVMVTYAQH
jgi:hypothetical protein